MAEPEVIFFDVGGVLLTNGWDREARHAASERFGIEYDELRERHDLIAPEFEQGEIDLDTYLTNTVFFRDRDFGRDEFIDFMRSRSRPIPETFDVLADLSSSGRYLLATLNNESRELNEYRIGAFGLRDHFSAFLSSCYLGVRKPEPAIYRIAVDIVQRPPEACMFIDDRDLNVECATLTGMRAIRFEGAAGLRADLVAAGVTL